MIQRRAWSFEQLDRAFAIIFADLSDEIIDGTAPALSDARMVEINVIWFETLDRAGWTVADWNAALDNAALTRQQLADAYQRGYLAGQRAGVEIGVDETIAAYDEMLRRHRAG